MPDEPSFEIHNQSPALPVQPGERIAFVDILRGFAVLGILVANMASFSGHTTQLIVPRPTVDWWVLIFTRFFVTAKFYSLFSFLFGWGLSVQMARARERGRRFAPLYLRRLLVLLLIGIVHGVLIWSGDILSIYALLGFLLFLIRNRSQRTILILVALCLLLPILLNAPWKAPVEIVSRYEDLTSFLRLELAPSDAYSRGSYFDITQLRIEEYLKALSKFMIFFGNLFSMFLLGLLVGKRRIFQEVEQNLPLLRKVMAGGLTLGVLGNALNLWLILHPSEMPVPWLPQSYHRMVQHTAYTLGAPALMLFYVSGMILLLRKKDWYSRLNPLANVGRMALSNYLFQSIIATLIFYNYGLGLFGEIKPFTGLVLTGFIFFLQIKISSWWFDHFRYGPVEWFWRFLTYGKSPQLLSGKGGELSKRFERIKMMCLSFKRFHPAWILSITWVVLLVWAGLLITWNQQLGATRRASALRSVISEMATSTEVITQPDEAGQAGEVPQDSNPAPTFRPVPYLPVNSAARGDVEALVGTFNLERALSEIETLTGAPYWGRQTGSPQGFAAGDYLATQFSRYGLQPLGDQGTYFQEFSVLYTPLQDIPRLYLVSSNNSTSEEFIPYQDFAPVVRWYAGSGAGKGQVYWMNHCSEEDFAAQDVDGKVLLCLRGSTQDWLQQLSRRALEHGAAALLFLTDPEIWPPDFGWSFKEIWVPEPLPVFYVYPEMVTRLLAGGEKTITDLLANARPYPLECTVGFEIKTLHTSSCPGPECIGRNILGILPGRDPSYASEAIILGAHYDHMGQTPTGIVWPGANDDASGVAVLLEIARSWNEQGYVPKRSVIFAAWDAEEVGLLGSIHYVKNPPFPLENTVGMIQLDMVGAGLATLNIDGDNSLSKRIEHIAETLGIETNISNTGGSDHVPFLASGVPASAFIWDVKPEGDDHYHRPTDTVLEIEEEQLRSAAQIAELAALNIAESEPSIIEMLTTRAEAAREGNLEAFLSSSHSDQVQNDLAWFQDLQSLQPTRVSLDARNISIAGNHASATVQIDVDTLETSENTTRTLIARIPVVFSYESSGWKWGGVEKVWNEIETSLDGKTVFQVGYPPGKEEDTSGVGSSAIEIYQRITGLLGLSPETQARLLILENEEVLWGSTALSQPRDRLTSVIPGEVKLVNGEALSTSLRLQDSLVQLALAEAGVHEALAPWLWQGLPLVLQGYDQPISTQIRFLPTLQADLAKGSPTPGLVDSWAASAYLQERLGWSGLGRFILKLGQVCKEGCDPDGALDATLLEFVNLDAAGFETACQSAWQLRIETAQGALNTLLSERSLAVSNGDVQALLNTIDPSVPNLDIEEIHWLEDYQTNPPEMYSLKGQPMAFLEGGGLLAEITMEYQPAGAESISSSFTILLTPSGTGYYWAGPLLERLQGEKVDFLYPSAKADLAATLLAKAEEIYVSLASILGIPETDKVTIKLYDTPASYRASISILLPQTIADNAWTNPGESIKLNIVEDDNPENYTGILADQLSRSLLYQRGIEDVWLVEGISAYLLGRYAIESSSPPSGLQTAELFEAADNGRMPALNDITPTFQLSRQELELGKSTARDAVDFMVSNYGWPALLDILDARERRTSLDQAFQSSLGISFDQFEQNWRISLLQKHLNLDWVESAQAFSPELAMESVDYLASPALEGRLAGSTGSNAAAYYIAEAFEAYGLLPVGDLIGETTSLEDLLELIPATNPDTDTLPAYFQTFPINYTAQASIPRLELLTGTGDPPLSLTYRQDFQLVQGDACTGTISAPLVWGDHQAYPNIDLEGKIILRTSSSDSQDEINTAISHGAAGLILTNNKRESEELFAKQLDTQQDSLDASIPVFEISQPGFSRLLEAFGYDRRSVVGLDAFQPFEGMIRLECSPPRFDTVETMNVLGLLPGSDPYLRQEVIILGAHYDHVGNDPDGLRYSGANDNASGVAVLLEIARLLHEQDYRPKSSILFVAWGAQELGQVGSNYYVSNPIFPLHDTIATIQLDGIGGGDGFSLGVQGSTETDGQILFTLSAAEQALQEELVYTAPFTESDDMPFRQAGVPSLLISWRLANEDNLPDELGKAVRPERLSVAGRVVALMLLALAR